MKEEEEPKKTGWFSRKSSTPTPRVSRPPSTTSYARKAQKSTSQTSNDDLPPRMESRHSMASNSSTSGQSEAGDSKPHLPLHAGFDFNAIKEVLGKSELNPEELKIRDDKHFAAPFIPPPTQRSESAPPPAYQLSPNTSIPSRLSLDSSEENLGKPRDDLIPTFSRSMSLDSGDNDYNSDESTSYPPPRETPSGPSSFHTPQGSPRHGRGPTLSFAGNDGSLWASAPEPEKFVFGAGPSTPFGASPLPSTTYPYSNPFAGPSLPDTGLSFGGADGSITSTLGPVADPWSIPSDIDRKKAPTFNSNPWD